MLGISRIGGGGESYYVNAVAEGVDEYYRGVGEAPGWWAGAGAHVELGLDGEVQSSDLRAIWNGLDPNTGEPLGRFTNRKVSGFDLCWRAPKSVSLLFAFGEPEVSRVVRDAHDAAVAEAFNYIEVNAARVRLGHGGLRSEAVGGLTAAMFRHRTSRSGDPHLHTHVLVANAARGSDGNWRTIDGRLLNHHSLTAGYLYQAHLRHELTRQLGVDWTPIEKGTADIVGIDREVIDAFSDRRRQIVEHLDEWGFRSARAAQIATLATRPDKPVLAEGTLHELWADKAQHLGWDPTSVGHALGPAALAAELPSKEEMFLEMVGAQGVTEHESTFGRPVAIRAVAERLPHGASAKEVLALADEFLEHDEVIALGGRPDFTYETLYSTDELLDLEQWSLTLATSSVDARRGVVDEHALGVALRERPSLSLEQMVMVDRLCLEGSGVAVVAAAAGTGKTFALAAAHRAWTEAGFEVIGAAVAAKAARELQEASDIPSTTLARLTTELRSGRRRFEPSTVLVIDEAGMAGTRDLAPILEAADAADAKVVLVGDDRQLPEITAGGLFGAIGRAINPIRLDENRRQIEPWERKALDELRCGDVSVAVGMLEEHGRLITAPDSIDLRQTMADDWWTARSEGREVAMIAVRNADVADLNGRARVHVADAGLLVGPTLVADHRPYQVGDEIFCLRNDYRLDVRNGDRRTVTAVDLDSGSMNVKIRGVQRHIPAEYLDDGNVTHGYAMTIHKAQGTTVDQCLVLGTDELHREAGYVALSRGRESNMLYLVGGVYRDVDTDHGLECTPRDPMELVTGALQQGRVKGLAIESLLPVQELLEHLDLLQVDSDRSIWPPHQFDDSELGL